jgi:hypothetical protein
MTKEGIQSAVSQGVKDLAKLPDLARIDPVARILGWGLQEDDHFLTWRLGCSDQWIQFPTIQVLNVTPVGTCNIQGQVVQQYLITLNPRPRP